MIHPHAEAQRSLRFLLNFGKFESGVVILSIVEESGAGKISFDRIYPEPLGSAYPEPVKGLKTGSDEKPRMRDEIKFAKV